MLLAIFLLVIAGGAYYYLRKRNSAAAKTKFLKQRAQEYENFVSNLHTTYGNPPLRQLVEANHAKIIYYFVATLTWQAFKPNYPFSIKHHLLLHKVMREYPPKSRPYQINDHGEFATVFTALQSYREERSQAWLEYFVSLAGQFDRYSPVHKQIFCYFVVNFCSYFFYNSEFTRASLEERVQAAAFINNFLSKILTYESNSKLHASDKEKLQKIFIDNNTETQVIPYLSLDEDFFVVVNYSQDEYSLQARESHKYFYFKEDWDDITAFQLEHYQRLHQTDQTSWFEEAVDQHLEQEGDVATSGITAIRQPRFFDPIGVRTDAESALNQIRQLQAEQEFLQKLDGLQQEIEKQKAEAEAKAQAEILAKEKAEAEAKTQAEKLAKEKAEAEAKAKAEAEEQTKPEAESSSIPHDYFVQHPEEFYGLQLSEPQRLLLNLGRFQLAMMNVEHFSPTSNLFYMIATHVAYKLGKKENLGAFINKLADEGLIDQGYNTLAANASDQSSVNNAVTLAKDYRNLRGVTNEVLEKAVVYLKTLFAVEGLELPPVNLDHLDTNPDHGILAVSVNGKFIYRNHKLSQKFEAADERGREFFDGRILIYDNNATDDHSSWMVQVWYGFSRYLINPLDLNFQCRLNAGIPYEISRAQYQALNAVVPMILSPSANYHSPFEFSFIGYRMQDELYLRNSGWSKQLTTNENITGSFEW